MSNGWQKDQFYHTLSFNKFMSRNVENVPQALGDIFITMTMSTVG